MSHTFELVVISGLKQFMSARIATGDTVTQQGAQNIAKHRLPLQPAIARTRHRFAALPRLSTALESAAPFIMQTRAMVIGSGMGGLATAQVLSEYFDNVIVIEKDQADETMQKTSIEAANMAGARHGVMQVRRDPAGYGSPQACKTVVRTCMLSELRVELLCGWITTIVVG